MTEHQDNAGEVVAGAVRVALTAAGQLAEQAARRREADLREAQRDSAARVATLQSQLAADRELAVQLVRDVVQRGDAATIGEVARAWEQARSWNDSTMAVERAKLEESIRQRLSVGAPGLAADRERGEAVTAVAVSACDAELQASDRGNRRIAQNEVVAAQVSISGVDIESEAAAAQALAAVCYPMSADHAVRRPNVAPVAKPRTKARPWALELRRPDRSTD